MFLFLLLYFLKLLMKHSLSCAYLHTITMGSNEIKRLLSGYRQCCGGNMISNNSCVKLFRITDQICEQMAIKKNITFHDSWSLASALAIWNPYLQPLFQWVSDASSLWVSISFCRVCIPSYCLTFPQFLMQVYVSLSNEENMLSLNQPDMFQICNFQQKSTDQSFSSVRSHLTVDSGSSIVRIGDNCFAWGFFWVT